MIIFENHYCQISISPDGVYTIHSLNGKYPDKSAANLTSAAIQTQIPKSTLQAAEKAAFQKQSFATFAENYIKNISNGAN